jgi:hypothetical protein
MKKLLALLVLLRSLTALAQPNSPGPYWNGGGTNSGGGGGSTTTSNLVTTSYTNIIFATNQALGNTYTNLYNVPITVFGGTVNLNSSGTGQPVLSTTVPSLSGATWGGNSATGHLAINLPSFCIIPNGTWSFSDSSTGTSSCSIIPSSFQVSVILPLSQTNTIAGSTAGGTNGILMLNGFGTNTTLTNATLNGSNTVNGTVAFNASAFFGYNEQFIFQKTNTAGGNNIIELTGSTNNSGPGFVYDIIGRAFNAIDTGIWGTNFWGYEIWDIPQTAGVPYYAPYGDLPLTYLDVSESVGRVFAQGGSHGNIPVSWQMVDPKYGMHFGLGYLGSTNSSGNGGTNNRLYGTTVKQNGTNLADIPADAPLFVDWDLFNATFDVYVGTFRLDNGVTLKTTNGVLIKSNGTLANNVAFDSADTSLVNLSAAQIDGKRFVTGSDSAVTGATGFYDGGVAQGFNMTGGSFGVTGMDNNTVMFCFGVAGDTFADGGIFPCGPQGSFFTHDNTWDLGTLLNAAVSTNNQVYTTNTQAWKVIAGYQFQSPFVRQIAGQTGAKTVNFPSGSIRIAAAGSSVVLTDSYITTNSIVLPVLATHDTTAFSVSAVPAAGSCTFFLNAAATGEVEIRWLVWNANQ